MNRSVSCLVIAMLLAGCTTLNVDDLPITPVSGSIPVASGAVYVLPFTQYSVTMTWRLADCSGPAPRVSVAAQAITSVAPDGDQAYVIDPSSLQNLTSIGAFKASWPDGSLMLSSINVSSEDRSAAIVGNVVTAAAKLVSVAFSIPSVPGALVPVTPPPPPPPPQCTPEAIATLATIATLKPQVSTLTGQIETLTADIATLSARAALLGTAVDDATRNQLADKAKQLRDLQSSQQVISRQLASALERVTSVRVERWPADSRTVATAAPFTIIAADTSGWFLPAAPPAPGAPATPPALRAIPAVSLQIERIGSFGRDTASGALPDQAVATGRGLRYRTPGLGRLVVCKSSPCQSSHRAEVLTEVEGQVAQLGYVSLLPVNNRAFGSTTFGAEFSTLGGLRTVGYEQKTAPAEGATGALSNAATELAPVFDPTARLNRETAYLTALQSRRTAAEALQPDPIGLSVEQRSVLEADTALIEARIANYEAQAALARLGQPQ